MHQYMTYKDSNARPVAGEGAGRLKPPPPPEFWKLKNITIYVQQSVLNSVAKSAVYNFTTFNRVRHLLR